jgi:hypothetical protein
VPDLGIVKINAKSLDYPSLAVRNVAAFRGPKFFESKIDPEQWLSDIPNDRWVKPTHYSIHSHSNNWYLRSWVLERSIDGSSWIILENRATTRRQIREIRSGHLLARIRQGVVLFVFGKRGKIAREMTGRSGWDKQLSKSQSPRRRGAISYPRPRSLESR